MHFNVPAPQGTYPDDWEYTATISLASIDADGDEDFTFTTDECSVLAHETTGELMLQAKIGVLGSPAHLNRFSYHVEVLSKIPVQTAVSGNIRWNHFYGDPTQAVLNGYSMFLVGPATFRAGGGLGGGGGAAGWTWDAQFTVYTSVPPQRAGDFWVVPYNITGLPLNQHLDIMPNLMPGALNGPSGGFNPMPLFTPPSYPITLTPSTPSRTGLDYEMTFAPLG